MAEMEKEGRPPENKRSRKPAHPVKREINEEMKVKKKKKGGGGVPSCMSLCVETEWLWGACMSVKPGVLSENIPLGYSWLHDSQTLICDILFSPKFYCDPR